MILATLISVSARLKNISETFYEHHFQFSGRNYSIFIYYPLHNLYFVVFVANRLSNADRRGQIHQKVSEFLLLKSILKFIEKLYFFHIILISENGNVET
jgi:hypothetical protein